MNWTHIFIDQSKRHLQHAVELFNRGEFYQAHEGFEKLWRSAEGDERQFFQGLVQVAVAFHFRTQGNFAGALGMLDLATRNLARYAGECHGLKLTTLLCTLSTWRTAIMDRSSTVLSPRMQMHGDAEARQSWARQPFIRPHY